MFIAINANDDMENRVMIEGVVAQWCNPLILQLEQLGGLASIRGSTGGVLG